MLYGIESMDCGWERSLAARFPELVSRFMMTKHYSQLQKQDVFLFLFAQAVLVIRTYLYILTTFLIPCQFLYDVTEIVK